MQILVMGAGAIGSVVGGFLARSGHSVTLVGRSEHMDAVAQRGLHITGIWGDDLIHQCATRTTLQGLKPGSFDVIFITVKSFDTRTAMQQVAPLVGPDTFVCSYQNGLGNAETIAEFVGWKRTVGARAIYGVRMTAPGAVDVTVIANPTALGVYDDTAPKERVRQLAKAMDKAGMPTDYTDAIKTVLWGKVTYNCALNPLSALLDVAYGDLLDTESTRSIMREIVHEVYAVAASMKVDLDPADPEGYVRHLFEDLIPPTAAHFASMHEDFARQRRTEIDALNGAICRYGDAHGVACPANYFLTRLVKAREHAYGAT